MPALGAYLAADHERIDELLTRATVAGPGGPIDLAAYEELRARLLRHIAIEEKLVFAAARQAGAGPPLQERLRRLHLEHAAITTLLIPTPDHALAGELRRALAPHDAAEEGPDGVYAACEELIGNGSAALLARVHAFPPVKVAQLSRDPRAVRTWAAALARAEGSAAGRR